MRTKVTRLALAACLLVGVLLAGTVLPHRSASAQGSVASSLLAVVEGREVVFVRSGPSSFYPIAGYVTAGSLIAVDGRSSSGTDTWLRTWLNRDEVWIPGWRLTVLGDRDVLPLYFRLHTPPYPITLQVEAMRGAGVLRLRRQALGDLTVRLASGQTRSAVVAAGGMYRLEVYFLNRGIGAKSIEVTIDGQVVSRTMVQVGITPGYNTIQGYDTGPFILPRGLHLVQVRIRGGDLPAIEMDEITLRPVVQRFPSTRPVG